MPIVVEQLFGGVGFPCRAECPTEETLQHKLGGQQRRQAGGAPLSALLFAPSPLPAGAARRGLQSGTGSVPLSSHLLALSDLLFEQERSCSPHRAPSTPPPCPAISSWPHFQAQPQLRPVSERCAALLPHYQETPQYSWERKRKHSQYQ